MAGSIQRAVKLDERKGTENFGSCPVVQSDKQQKLDGTCENVQRKAALQAEALQRLQRRRVTEGNAGGFLDRQDASDRRQWDSDDEEFDEFGRRKKRKKDGTAFVKKKKKDVEPEILASSTEPSSHRSGVQERQPPKDGDRVEGVVRWYESTKAFGFVRTPGIDADIYFKDPDRTLAPVEGMKVTFIVRITPDGKPQARSVMRGCMSEAAEALASAPRPAVAAKSSSDSPDALSSTEAQSSGMQDMASEAMMMMQAQTMMYMQMMSQNWTSTVDATASQTVVPTDSSNPMPSLNAWQASENGQSPANSHGSSDKGALLGHVKSYNPSKGFGFIQSNAVTGDIYFKGSFPDIRGRTVSFKCIPRGDKHQATDIEILY